MKKKTKIIIAVCVFACLIFGVGVPVLINELYKLNKGYVTMWSCGELLDFYGSLLGSVATIAALVATIWFTRKQIKTDRYIESETKKWKSIEDVFDEFLVSLDPSILVDATSAYLIHRDVKRLLSELIDALIKIRNNFAKAGIISEEEKELSYLYENSENLWKKWRECEEKITKQAAKDNGKSIYTELIGEANKLFTEDYQRLLKEKTEFFSNKYKSIENKANEDL